MGWGRGSRLKRGRSDDGLMPIGSPTSVLDIKTSTMLFYSRTRNCELCCYAHEEGHQLSHRKKAAKRARCLPLFSFSFRSKLWARKNHNRSPCTKKAFLPSSLLLAPSSIHHGVASAAPPRSAASAFGRLERRRGREQDGCEDDGSSSFAVGSGGVDDVVDFFISLTESSLASDLPCAN